MLSQSVTKEMNGVARIPKKSVLIVRILKFTSITKIKKLEIEHQYSTYKVCVVLFFDLSQAA